MITVALLGQPLWCGRLAELLSRRPELNAKSVAGRQLLSWSGLQHVLQADLLLRVGFRPGGSTVRAVLYDAFWSLLRVFNRRAKVVYYWIGTDVLTSLEDFRAGTLRRGPHTEARAQGHWADAPWLVEELAELQFRARFHPIPVPLKGVDAPRELPAPFMVLTYIPDGRASFYGGREVVAAARALPSMAFEVLGGEGGWVGETLPNLKFVGWQKDIRPFLERCSVLLRLVAHDGLGGTVREALEAGRHVVYTQAMPHVATVPFGDADALIRALDGLHGAFLNGQLRPNEEGRRYVREAYDLDRALEIYVQLCREALEEVA